MSTYISKKTLFVDTGVYAHIDQDVAYFKMKTAQSSNSIPETSVKF